MRLFISACLAAVWLLLGLFVLYPQVDTSSSPDNEYGCWDWWGYTGSNYAHKSAPQMKAIMAMAKRLARAP